MYYFIYLIHVYATLIHKDNFEDDDIFFYRIDGNIW